MGWQQFGPKKIRRVAALTGMPIDMVWNHAGETAWHEARTTDDEHLLVNVETGEIKPKPKPWGKFTSCPKDHDWHGQPSLTRTPATSP